MCGGAVGAGGADCDAPASADSNGAGNMVSAAAIAPIRREARGDGGRFIDPVLSCIGRVSAVAVVILAIPPAGGHLPGST
ncbi:hypothetical protein MSAS_05220 [Mycobacterium saskatchewanense]|nr:hypothetical protein MSAS_05220 [Mycobacterium saskatchewanense]